MDPDDLDPRGLIREAYRMELGPADCRSIFLDWALGLDAPADARAIASAPRPLRAAHPDHPMTAVLREGIGAAPEARRRRPRR